MTLLSSRNRHPIDLRTDVDHMTASETTATIMVLPWIMLVKSSGDGGTAVELRFSVVRAGCHANDY